MKRHRIRSAKSVVPGRTRPHIFLELLKNTWLEVSPVFTHKAIHRFLRKERKSKTCLVKYDERAFHIGIVENWSEAGYLV